MSEYVELIENNDWEGERWSFHLPIAGNEDALNRLETEIIPLANEQFEDAFKLRRDRVRSTSEVQVLVDNADMGYMARHTKCAGTLRLPEQILDAEAAADLLYKGGIKKLFVS